MTHVTLTSHREKIEPSGVPAPMWKTQAAGIFCGNAIEPDGRERIRELDEKIGELTADGRA